VLTCWLPASAGRPAAIGGLLKQDAGVAALVERAPAGHIMAAPDPAGLGGVVAGGPATEPATAVAVSEQRTTRTPSS
jgi:hypothetical protein